MATIDKINVNGTEYDLSGSDTKVTQSPVSTDAHYELLFSHSANNSEETNTVGKSPGALFDPFTRAVSFGSRYPNTTVGLYSQAEGYNVCASNKYSHAEGNNSAATGESSHAEGDHAQATGNYSHAEGRYTTASGIYGAHAEGNGSTASGDSSHAEGQWTTAQRKSQHVFGEYNVLDTTGANGTVKGSYVEIVGNGTADNARSNARTLDWSGNETLAGKLTVGAAPTADMDVATKKYVDDNITVTSVAGKTGAVTLTASDVGALASTTKYAGSASAGGSATSAEKLSNTSKVGDTNKPVYFTANGVPSAISYTIDKSVPSNAVFTDTNTKVTQTPTTDPGTYELLFSGTADNTTHTEGARKSSYATFDPSKAAFTFGSRLTNSTVGQYSVAEGVKVEASGIGTHAEGNETIASKFYAHAEGESTTASGQGSHAEGGGTIAQRKYQHVFGMYNKKDTEGSDGTYRGKYIEIVGCGTGTADSARDNARALDWNGNEELKGGLTVGGAVNFANNTWNKLGDDVYFGDNNVSGAFCIKGQNGQSKIQLVPRDGGGALTCYILSDNIGFHLNSGGGQMRLEAGNNNICSMANSGFLSLTADGTAYNFVQCTSAYNPSSRLIKENIENITDDDAKKVLQLRPVTFDMIHGDKDQAGMIAEEVLEILPNTVMIPKDYDEEKAKEQIEKGELPNVISLDYSKFVPYLIKMIQVQQNEIDELKEAIK